MEPASTEHELNETSRQVVEATLTEILKFSPLQQNLIMSCLLGSVLKDRDMRIAEAQSTFKDLADSREELVKTIKG